MTEPELPAEALDRLIRLLEEWPLYTVSKKELLHIRSLLPDYPPRAVIRCSAPEQVEVE